MKRGDIVLVVREGEDPNVGALCAVISPDELNEHLPTVIVAPIGIQAKPAPFRVELMHEGKRGQILLEQCSCVSKTHVQRRVGALSSKALASVLGVMQALFSP